MGSKIAFVKRLQMVTGPSSLAFKPHTQSIRCCEKKNNNHQDAFGTLAEKMGIVVWWLCKMKNLSLLNNAFHSSGPHTHAQSSILASAFRVRHNHRPCSLESKGSGQDAWVLSWLTYGWTGLQPESWLSARNSAHFSFVFASPRALWPPRA